MAYTLGDLVTKVQNRIRDTGYSSTEIKNYINDAQNDVFNEYTLPFVETTQTYSLTADDPDVSSGTGLPTNYVQAIDLTLTTSGYEKTLPFISFGELDQMYPDPQDLTAHPANVPSMWYYYDDNIYVFPSPLTGHSVSLRYYKKPTVLSADADVPEIPSQFEELLVEGATYRVLQVKDNYDQAGIHQNKFDEILQKLVVRYSQAQVGTPSRMRINRSHNGPSNF
jgi:hypothetical protein